jgi:hypothetical protein
MIINDDSSIVSKWSFKLIDDHKVVIYDRHRFIIQATGAATLSTTAIGIMAYSIMTLSITIEIYDTRPWANFSQQDKTWAKFLNFRNGRMFAVYFICYTVKLPSLKLGNCDIRNFTFRHCHWPKWPKLTKHKINWKHTKKFWT